MLACPIPPGVPQLPAKLKSDGGFSSARRHREEQATLAYQDRLDGAVHGNLLVVTFALGDGVIERGQQPLRGFRVFDVAPVTIPLPQLAGRRIIGARTLPPGEVIELDDLRAVGRVGEFQAEHLRVIFRLLQPVCSGLVAHLGLDDGEGKIARVAKKKVHALRRLADEPFSDRNNAAVRDGTLLRNRMRLILPAGILQARNDKLSTSICFRVSHEAGGMTVACPGREPIVPGIRRPRAPSRGNCRESSRYTQQIRALFGVNAVQMQMVLGKGCFAGRVGNRARVCERRSILTDTRSSKRVQAERIRSNRNPAITRKTFVPKGFPRGAGRRIRTDDLLITNQLLYQLSYAGVETRGVSSHGVSGAASAFPIPRGSRDDSGMTLFRAML